MYSKFLFVGLGGSGGKTLRFLKREMLRWMRTNAREADIPDTWQFLHIDTPTQPDGQEINDIAPQLAADEYMGLINTSMDFRSVQNRLDGEPSLRDELRSWRVEPAGLGVSVDQGAGQFRAVGQTVAMAYARRIREKLQERVDLMSGANAQGQLGQLYDQVKSTNGATARQSSNMYIVVVGSLAGGSGAGLLNLVCDILRAMDTPAGDGIFALLYTPEVFDSLGGSVTGGIYPNSLAAICELLNGQWWQGSVVHAPTIAAPKQNATLIGAGLPKPQERSGPTYPFLVGRVAEGGVDLGNPDRVFEITGRSLLSWVTDEVVQSRFVAYTSGNWAQSALAHEQGEILVNGGESNEKGLPCLSALGFSRLSVGGEHFERYAQRRLVKDALNHLTRFHTDSDEAAAVARNLETQDPDAILGKIAKNHHDNFLHETQLTEVGPEDNQIIDTLRPERAGVLEGDFLQQVKRNSDFGYEGKRNVEEWRRNITDAIAEARRHFEANYRHDLELSKSQWIEDIRERIIREVEHQIGMRGLLVSAQLCMLTARYLTHDVVADMNNEITKVQSWAEQVDDVVNGALETATGDIPGHDDRIVEAIEKGVNAANYAADALLYNEVATLARQIAEKIFEPLALALRNAHSLAESDARRVVSWPNWDDQPPPHDVRPPVGDFSLIEVSAYANHFADLLSDDIGEAVPSQEQRQKVRGGVISGSFLEDAATAADPEIGSCLAVERDWYPDGLHSRPSASLRVSLSTGVEDLIERAHAWLRRPGSAWDRFLSRSLRDFVGDTDSFSGPTITEAEARQNRSRFINQLQAALAAAAPLVNIDERVLGLVHPNTAQHVSRLQLSSMPLASHPIEKELRATLAQAGIGQADIESTLNTDSSVNYVDITSALSSPISVLAVASLLRPISERWYQLNSANQRKDFWAFRRAQPLESFIPAPQALIRCMVRGWFTGRLLGVIKAVDHTSEIWIPQDEAYMSFAQNWLSAPQGDDTREALPLALEALALAYVEVSRDSLLRPLLPYIELRELGRSKQNGGLFSYDSLAPAFEGWVKRGELVATAEHAVLNPTASSEPTSQIEMVDRLEQLSRRCRETIDSYSSEYSRLQNEWQAQPATLSKAPHWTGLWERHINPALNDIMQAADRQARQVAEGPRVSM